MAVAPLPSASRTWAVAGALAVVYVVWGSTYLAIRLMVETMPALLSAGGRFALAGAVMLAVVAARRGAAAVRPGRGQLAGAALIGTLLVAGGNGLVTVAENHEVPSGLAALIVASVPLWIVLMRAATRDRVDRLSLVGVLAGFGGLGLLLLPGGGSAGAPLGAMLLVVLASASWATGSFSSRRVALPADPFASTGLQMLCGGAVMLAGGLATGEAGEVDVGAFSATSIAAWAYLVVAGSLVAFTAYVWLLQHAPVSTVATYAYVNPVIAVFLGWAVVDESLTTTMLVATAVVVASVALTVRRESPPPPAGRPDAGAPPDDHPRDQRMSTRAPTGTRRYRSITSRTRMRMHP